MQEQREAIEAVLVGLLARYGVSVVGALVIGIVGLLLARWASRAVMKASLRTRRLSPTLAPVISKLVRVSILAVTLVAVLDKFGVETTSVLAFLGAFGLAVGLALKDTVSDVASGVVLLILRPFDVGEAVDIEGTGGVVDVIDIFETKLTTFDGIPVVLPNSKVRSAKIQNYSRALTRRIDLTVGISYEDDIGKAIGAIREIVLAEPRVLAEPAPVINTNELGDSSVDLLVRVTTLPADFLATKLDLTRAIKERLDAVGVTIPFPQRSVRIVSDTRAA